MAKLEMWRQRISAGTIDNFSQLKALLQLPETVEVNKKWFICFDFKPPAVTVATISVLLRWRTYACIAGRVILSLLMRPKFYVYRWKKLINWLNGIITPLSRQSTKVSVLLISGLRWEASIQNCKTKLCVSFFHFQPLTCVRQASLHWPR